ncbi:RNA polymerase sigma factor [Pseudomonas kuykendallii]|uniref:RNA polymerase subunit sigma-24 n=1 Tax=Pseudomonas kuykendallii TaxID=1007099 RepID=A0A2W5D3R5_9PSED|nr:RNA polymerase sigma factor [Pseudomonas kuykendallii]PZP24384.1 MAG: RNA polymerase subunit sigma-24 [Pseudomonas kuykendallii]
MTPDRPSPEPPPLDSQEDFLRVFLANRQRLELLVSRQVGCRATAADLVQDLFLRFWRRPVLQVEEMGTYLLRCARNLAIDHLRLEGSRSRTLNAFPMPDGQRPDALEAGLLASDDLRNVDAALRGLPERTRHIFLLNRIHGCTYGEIARAVGVSQSAVEKHMMRALEACKASLANPPAPARESSAPGSPA